MSAGPSRGDDADFLVWGAYGGHNFGDEAILRAVSYQLRRVRPNARQYVTMPGKLSPAVAEHYRAAGIEAVPLFSFRCLKLLVRTQLVAGGGQLLDDHSLGWPGGYTCLLLGLNRLFANRPVLLCIGANPVHRRLVRAMVRFGYSLATKCTCRDEGSAAALVDCGIRPSRVQVTRDIVFALESHHLPRRAAAPGGKHVAIAVCHDPMRKPGDCSTVAILVRELLAAGFHVELTGHDLRPAYDRYLLEALQAELRDVPDVSFVFPDSLDSLLQLYASCHFVISNRMHPLILASLLGSVPIAIAETPKVQALVDNLGIPALDTSSSGQLGSQLIAVLERRSRYESAIARQLVAFRSTVENTVDALFVEESGLLVNTQR
ncbi:MAG TPA: polysaccharide pyruvyl transferase family protein [Candidatus Koribacter sp.]|jgi:polysaccharide pyruvyl transferase WcaK-like protein